ncbi:MAG: UDP-N-acetylmuramoyl-L-alanyl-D-glutamate--2,6-diaminopimelate ligase [Muribaculaceae bacterium]|nr:UDP-N-acetylmuramoyl-L-alanyl-D-glutamate--2,6-diaminopimelate ligase [Muribaculaceae bacterium]
MTLSQIFSGIKIKSTSRSLNDSPIGKITFDSRLALPGDIFVALKGFSSDGHDFIPSLLSKGLAAIVVENLPENISLTDETFIVVDDTHETLGKLASNFYRNPSAKLKLVGVTGTNGKTTIATLIYQMARMGGKKAGLISTVANYIDDEVVPATHTTPDPLAINQLLAEMVNKGCEIVAMEVSSHAAHQKRIAGLEFDGAVFTNLTRDHLDYHGTFANYRDAKKIFFDQLPTGSFALINADDKNANFLVQNTRSEVFTYSLHSQSDFHCRILEKNLGFTLVSINNNEIYLQFTGEYNSYNLTAVYGVALLLGFQKESVLLNLSKLTPVAGRFQTFRSSDNVTAVIDYAHTPDALANVLESIREVMNSGRLITVVGAGGNRDKGKRPMMGKVAVDLSDIIILTSDNPRDEDPAVILEEIGLGIPSDNLKPVIVIQDRREAIRAAVAMTRQGDVILVAGKGHENYQEIKGVKHHFDDREEIQKAMKIC